MSDKKTLQSGNEFLQQNVEAPNFAKETQEHFRTIENLTKNPKETLTGFAEEKVDNAVTKWMNTLSEKIGKYIPESLKNIGNSILEFFGIKEWFSSTLEKIKNWSMGAIGGIMGIDFIKNSLDKGSDYIKQGKDLFTSFLNWLSAWPLKEYINPVREFVNQIDFKQIKKVFTNPQDVYAEIKKQVGEKFPEVGYYFAIDQAENITDEKEKVDAKQVALFDYAIGHFDSIQNIDSGLKIQLKLMQKKSKTGWYAEITEEDWANLEKELQKNRYELIKLNWLYYFEKEGGQDMYILGYLPWKEIEEISKIKINKFAISNALYHWALEWIETTKEVFQPFVDFPKEITEHFANTELSSLTWHLELLSKLAQNGIGYVATATGLTIYNAAQTITLEGLWASWQSAVNIVSLRVFENPEEVGNEYLKAVTPLVIVWAAIGWGKALVMATPRMAEDILKRKFSFLPTLWKTGVDIWKGAVIYGLGAPITIPFKILEAGKTILKWEKLVKHIPQTIKVNLDSLKHSLKKPVKVWQGLLWLRHKEELLYEDLLHYKQIEAYYSTRKNDDIFKASAQKELDHARKEIGDIEDILKKRGGEKYLKEHQRMLNQKIDELRQKPWINDEFETFRKKHWIEKTKDIFSIKKDWLSQKALKELREEGKIGRLIELKAYGQYLEDTIQSKIKAVQNFGSKTKKLYGKTLSGEIFVETGLKIKEKVSTGAETIKAKSTIVTENNFAKPEDQNQTFAEKSKEIDLEINQKLDKLWEESDSAYKKLVEAIANDDKTAIEQATQTLDASKKKIKETLKENKNLHLEAGKTRPIGKFSSVTMKGASTLFVGLEAGRIIDLFQSWDKRAATRDALDLTARLAPLTGTYIDAKEALEAFKKGNLKDGAISSAFAVLGGISDVLLFTGVGTAIGAGGRAGIVSLKAWKMALKGTQTVKTIEAGRIASESIQTIGEATKAGIQTTRQFLTAKKAAGLAIWPLAIYLMSKIPPSEEEIK